MPHLETQFAHLGLNATATVEPPFDGMAWYAGYEQRHAADGIEGRLVMQYTSPKAGLPGKSTRTARSWSSAPRGK